MTLIIFDIDGTLTATNYADAKCYEAAFEKVFGMPLPTTDWNAYVESTDSGIIHEVMFGHRGTKATQEEVDAFERRFVTELEAEFAVNPGAFLEIPGAKAILEAIGARPGLKAAIATGGMRGSATYKLSRIGVDVKQYPAGFANDSTRRHTIAACAIRRCGYEPEPLPDVVYVGDGPWDARTSAEMGMRFIGITGDAHASRLAAEGAKVCIDNYSDQEAFFEAVAAAAVPRKQ